MEEWTELIRDAQAGSTHAFSTLVGRFQNMAYGYAYAVLGDFDQAQDAAQEAFIESYCCLHNLREPLAFPIWLKRIVYKHCDRIIRRTWRETRLEGVPDFPNPHPGPPEISEGLESARMVQAAIHAMPPNQRDVTVLFYIGGYSLREISDFLEVPVQTVKSRLHASRKRLRERMLDMMVQDEFNHNPLPDSFTQETVEQAVKHAVELNQKNQYGEAESLLRQVLTQAPAHPAALRELNRALMHGKVYGHGRWDLLRELAEHGQAILHFGADEGIFRQVAKSLLAVPAMSEAANFINDWIATEGPNMERLGMLAWATGCLGDYNTSYTYWQEIIKLTQSQPGEEVLARLPFIAYTLVDCLVVAGNKPRAAEIAKQVWEICGELGALPAQGTFSGDVDWLLLWHTAGLDPKQIAPTLLARRGEGLDEQATSLAIRAWVDAPDQVTNDAFAWVRARTQSSEYKKIEKIRGPVLIGLRKSGHWREANRMAQDIWQLLDDAGVEVYQAAWSWERFNPMGAIETGEWPTAMAIAQQEIASRGVKDAIGWTAIVFGGAGEPTPPEIVQAIQNEGVEAVDEYGMFGWYILAREAARTGHAAEAFNALKKTLEYWTNPPYGITDLWEKDAVWGPLREHPEFKAAFDARRARIGPIYGLLHYFPGW